MNKDNVKKAQPKGLLGFIFLLLCLTGAAAGVFYFLNTTVTISQPVLIAGMAITCAYDLGALVCFCCRRSGGTVLLSLTQTVMTVALLGMSVLTVMEFVSVYRPRSLENAIDTIRSAVGLSVAPVWEPPIEGTIPFRAAVAAVSVGALLHALLSFAVLSALKKFYRGTYKKTGTVVLFGFVSMLLAAGMGHLFSVMSWGIPHEESLTIDGIFMRRHSVVFNDTLSFERYALTDWALLAWIGSAVLALLTLSFFSFRLAGKISKAKREAAFEEAIPAEGDSLFDDLAPAAAAAGAAEALWDEDIPDEQPQSHAQDDFGAVEDEFGDITRELPEGSGDAIPVPPAGNEQENSGFFFGDPEPQSSASEQKPDFESQPYSEPYDEFKDVTAPPPPRQESSCAPQEDAQPVYAQAAAAVPVAIPGTGLLDYGYSEDTII